MAWGWLFKRKPKTAGEEKPRKKRGRPTKEMLVQRRSRKIQDLKDQILEAQLQAKLDALKNSGNDGAYSLRIDDIPKIQRQLQRVGLDLGDGDDEAEPKSWLQDLLRSDEGRTLVLLAAQRFLGQPVPLAAPPAAPAALPQPTQQIASPATAAAASTVGPAPAAAAPSPAPSADPNAGLSEALIAGLDGKSPAVAAAWLVDWSGQQQGGDMFLQFLRDVPPPALAATVQQIATLRPYLVGFAAWLNAPDRANWTVETATELRKLLAQRTGLG